MAQQAQTQVSLVEYQAQGTSLVGRLLTLFPDQVIESETQLQDATEVLAMISTWLKSVEAGRVTLTKPLNDIVHFLNSEIQKVTGMVKTEDKRIRGLMSAFILVQRQVAEEAAARAAEIQDEGDEGEEAESLFVQKSVVADNARVDFKDNWVWEEVDITLVPREYLMIDRGKTTAAVKGKDGKHDIPGLRIWNEPVPAVTGGFRRPEINEGGLNARPEGTDEGQEATPEADTAADRV